MTTTPTLVSSSQRLKKGFGLNQQLSVASILAILVALAAIGTGYFPETNTYSLLAGGVAVLLSARATLYALTGTVFSRVLPVLALLFSLAAMTFCLGWPYVSDEVTARVNLWLDASEAQQESPFNSTPEVKPEAALDPAQDAKRKADAETYRLIKEAAKRENGEAVKPPQAPQ